MPPVTTTSGELDDSSLADLIGGERRSVDDRHRPWVMTNMVSSLDGTASVDGVSKGLGGPGDRAVFAALRAQADVVVVGAGTVRAERYRMPLSPRARWAEQRVARIQSAAPALAVISASLDLDSDLPFLAETMAEGDSGEVRARRIIVTVRNAPQDRRRTLADRCTIIDAGIDTVEPRVALDELGSLGHHVVLCEGGPRLIGAMIAAGVVDEWNQTIAPVVAARRVHAGFECFRRLRSSLPVSRCPGNAL